MENSTIRNLVGILIIGVVSFCIGMGTGTYFEKNNNSFSSDILPQVVSMDILKDLPVGASIEIELEEYIDPSTEFSQGEKIEIQANKDYGRLLSWWGIGAPEAAAKDQGIDVQKGGLSAKSGQVKGYGFLEQLWSRIKSILWFGSFTLIFLVILMFIPATAPIAGGILRMFASIIPIFGSIVERVFSGLKYQKPLKQTVAGGQIFKQRINNHPSMDDNEKKDVIQIFKDSMMIKQDTDSQKTINTIKKNGI